MIEMIIYVINRMIFELKELQKKIYNMLGKTIFKPIRMYRNSKIKNKHFSIISNNCWGGMVYQKLNLPYLSPTIGLYFYADDYIKFVSNLEYYLSIEPVIIDKEQSKYKNELSKLKVYRYFPIGKIDDVEIIFLHYRSDNEAIEKWEKRKKRIDMNNVIIKFNDQNNCTEEHLKSFDLIDYRNKICFIAQNKYFGKNSYIIKQRNSEYVRSDMRAFKRPLNIINYINMLKEDC